jgi:hypothetical protein
MSQIEKYEEDNPYLFKIETNPEIADRICKTGKLLYQILTNHLQNQGIEH